MKECLSMTRLATYETKEVCCETLAQLKEAMNEWSQDGTYDLDLEYVSGCLTGKNRHQLPQLWEWSETFNVPLETVGRIANVLVDLEDLPFILEERSYAFIEADNKFLAFREHLTQLGELENIPPHIVDYIDFEAWYQDSPVQIERVEGVTTEKDQALYLVLPE